MDKKIGKTELDAFAEMENRILSVGNESDRISYKKDDEIESKIKYSVLCENFSKIKVDTYFKNKYITMEILADHDRYVEIFNKLKMS